MPIWKLTPIDPTNSNWTASTHRGETTIRAATEEKARARARSAFWIATKRTPGESIRFPPWGHSDLVRCERLEGSEYPDDGPEEILVPEDGEMSIRG